MPAQPSKTRGDIQGLRAVAVIAVLLFHVDVGWAAGGYLGVDIFFVISGFLITRILYEDVLVDGRISLVQFYIRRVRRLLPALVVTVAITLVVGAAILSTSDQMALGESSLAAIFSLSNILFWSQAGYFDQDAALKPLLHTWSLGVEEQFYLFWPALILIVGRFGGRAIVVAIALASVVSLAAAQWLVADHPSAVFFLTPFRVFEFGAGALLCLAAIEVRSERFRDVAYAIGLSALLYSCIALDATVPMPGLYSLVPVLGTALCIAAGTSPLSAAISSRPMVLVGDMSYSLYLVHWPLVVFYKYVTSVELSTAAQVGLIAASVVLGYLLHIGVERPLRQPEFWERRRIFSQAALVFIGSVGAAASAWATNGWEWRVPEEIRQATTSVPALRAERMKAAGEALRGQRPEVVLIGDSHGVDLLVGLHQNGIPATLIRVRSLCQPVLGPRPPASSHSIAKQMRGCHDTVQEVINSNKLKSAKVVLLAPRWKEWAVPLVANTLVAIKKQTNAKIVLFGSTVTYSRAVPTIVQAYGRRSGLDSYAAKDEKLRVRAMNAELREIAQRANVTYVDKIEVLCGDNPCPLFVPGTNRLMNWDSAHWTAEGAKYFAALLLREVPDLLARPVPKSPAAL